MFKSLSSLEPLQTHLRCQKFIFNGEEFKCQSQIFNLSTILRLIEKYQLVNPNKSFVFNEYKVNSNLNLDIFHFENAIGNIVDNAVKYGGDKIEVEVTSANNQILIFIKDILIFFFEAKSPGVRLRREAQYGY